MLAPLSAPIFSYDCSNPIYGQTVNPHNLQKTSGGSSGGEGALIGGGGSPLGIGTDIGGSIRIPASFCGICGFKPTTGRLRWVHLWWRAVRVIGARLWYFLCHILILKWCDFFCVLLSLTGARPIYRGQKSGERRAVSSLTARVVKKKFKKNVLTFFFCVLPTPSKTKSAFNSGTHGKRCGQSGSVYAGSAVWLHVYPGPHCSAPSV